MATSKISDSNALEIPQDQGFINFYKSLSEKPATTLRLFNRGDFYTLHGQDAVFCAKEHFKTLSVLKILGFGAKKLESVALNQTHFENFVRELLLVKHYCIEIYAQSSRSGKNDWAITQQASPGNLVQVEDLIFGSTDLTTTTGILAVVTAQEKENYSTVGCCYVDVNDRKFLVCQFTETDSFSNLQSLIVQLGPKVGRSNLMSWMYFSKAVIRRYNGLLLNETKKSDFASLEAITALNRLLRFRKGQQENAAALPEVNLSQSMAALAALVKYLNLTGDESNFGQFSLLTFDLTQYVKLDAAAAGALHLTSYEAGTVTASVAGSAPRTLASLLNKCRTSCGQRLLAQWIKQPLTDKGKIEERLDLVETFVNDVHLRQSLTEDHLRRMPDLQRLSKRLHTRKANLQDIYKIYQALVRLPVLISCLQEHEGSHAAVLLSVVIQPLRTIAERLTKLRELIETTVDIPKAEQGDFVIKSDFDEKLGEYREQMDECKLKMEGLLQSAARSLSLDVKSVKLESNPQLGFFFRVTLKDEKSLRNNRSFRTIDTNKSGVRFRNTALEEANDVYTAARREYEHHQQDVVKEVLDVAAGYTSGLQQFSDNLAQLDVLTSFAVCSINAPIPYVRPTILERGTGSIELIQLRHPCMELQDRVNFIPNDAVFHKDGHRFYIITGPNMGGKSTYLRSVGVAVLMAQLGCFVAAESATVSIVDAILARVGAGDCHIKGISTFMAEMVDTANIMKTATADSLVIIDELGRGTSTFDGFGLAWAIAEHIATDIKPYALFASHFHELTALADQVPSVSNLHVTALTGHDTFTLLYRLQPGSCDQSFGLHVAEMVHFPESVLKSAKSKAAELESTLKSTVQENSSSDSSEPAAKIPRKEIEEGHILIDQYILKGKTLRESVDAESQLKQLSREVRNCNNPYVRSLLGL
nr:EOG090X02H9 [Sida crystallina]